MISHKPLPLKHLGLWSIFLFSALLTAYILFAAIVAIWVGLSHVQQNGFWMPILAGTLALFLALWLFLRFSRFILNRMKEKDTINI